MPGAVTPCLLWQGAKVEKGYGRIRVDGKTRVLHRAVWEEHHGPIPPGMVVRHSCDEPSCYEITHLVLGTYADNEADKRERGRYRGAYWTECKRHREQGNQRDCRNCRRIERNRRATLEGPEQGSAPGSSETEVKEGPGAKRW
jgi:hypothetical protein